MGWALGQHQENREMVEENPAVDEELTTDAEGEAEEEEAGQEEADKEPDEAAKLKEAVEVLSEDVGTLRKKLTITVPRDYLDGRLTDEFTELKRESIVPGFRKGRAPLRLVEKRFGHEVGDQLVAQLVGGGFTAAVEKEDLKTLGDPLIWVQAPVETGEGGRRSKETTERLVSVEEALEHMKLPDEGPLTFSCEVELRPAFDLPPLEGIVIERPKVAFTDDDVRQEVDRYRAVRGHYAPTSEPIVADDLVIADMTYAVDGKVVKEEKNVTLAARAQRVEGVVLPDLADALKGKQASDSVEVKAEIPDDHETSEYRGKEAVFTFAIQDVKRLELPPLDEEFFESIGFESETDLKDHIRSSLESQLDMLVQRGMYGQIGKYLLENTKLEVPPGLSQRQTERLVLRRMIDMYQRGLAEMTVQKQMDELRARTSEEVVKELKLFFIMEKIAEQMEIDVGDDELNGEIARIARAQGKRFDRVRDELTKANGLTALYLQLRDHKILDELLKQAEIKEIERGAGGAKSESGDA